MKNWRRRTYCGMVSAIDDGIGRIYKTLLEEGQANNTIILFTTDNGGAPAVGGFNYPYRGQKGTIYEGGFKTPAILHVPNAIVHDALYNNTIHLVDFAPTLLGLVDRSSGGVGLERLGKYQDLGEGIDGMDHTKWMMQSVGGRSLQEFEAEDNNSSPAARVPPPGPPRQTTVLEYSIFNDHASYLEGEWKLLLGAAGRSDLFVEPHGRYYDDNGRPRFILEELASDIFDRGLGDNWFLYGWAMRFGVDFALSSREPKSERRRNNTAYAFETATNKPFNYTIEVTEERLPQVDYSNFNPREIQLYNLKDDPYERTNLALDNQELVESMVARLREKVKEDPNQFIAVQKQFITNVMPNLIKLIVGFLVCAALGWISIGYVVWSKVMRNKTTPSKEKTQ